MARPFVVRTTPAFERDARKRLRRHPDLRTRLARALAILGEDPQNRTRQHDILKLAGVPAGEGRYRLRLGDWRFRYDVCDTQVVLHLCRRRPEAYR